MNVSHDAIAQARPRAAWLILGAAILFIAVWPLILQSFGGDRVYVSLGLYSLVIIATMTAVGWKAMPLDRGASVRGVLIGVVTGVVMTVATYLAYHLCVALFPGLAHHVSGLYVATRTTNFAAALAWTALAVVAEEVLWRGALLNVFPRGSRRNVVIALSLLTYAAVQFGTGSWIVALAALICGAIWMVERLWTRSIVAPLISHAIWTMTVIHLYPVTSS